MSSRKHLLLLNPWAYDFTAYDFWLRPLGLLYLASVIRQYTDFELDYLDCLDCSQIASSYHFRPKGQSDGRGSFLKRKFPSLKYSAIFRVNFPLWFTLYPG